MMFIDSMALGEDDHVVPDPFISGPTPSPTPSFHYLTDPTEKVYDTRKEATLSNDQQLWADLVEDVLALEEISETTLNTTATVAPVAEFAATKPNSRKALKLEQFKTPDFSLLINVDTPEPHNPDVQEVPLLHGSVITGMTLSNSHNSERSQCNSVALHSKLTTSQVNRTQLTIAQATSTSQVRTVPTEPQSLFTQLLNAIPATATVLHKHQGPTTTLKHQQVQTTTSNHHQNLTTVTNHQLNSTNTHTKEVVPSAASATGLMDSLVHIRNSMIMDFSNPFEVLGGSIDFDEDPDAFLQGGTSGLMLEERIKYTCTVLDIPMDPNSWSVEQVQKWAMFVLKPYEGLPADPDSIINLTVSGSTLTKMTKEDLICHFPQIGETLYNELEVWCFGLMPFSNSIVPQIQAEPAYVDLDAITKTSYRNMCMQSHCTSSPTAPMTSSIPALTSSEAVLPPLCALMPSQMFIKQEQLPEISPLYMNTDINPLYIKQEMPEPMMMNSSCSNDVSPISSPCESGYSPYSTYSQGSTSSGSSSPDDIYESHKVTRSVLPPRSHGGKHTIQLWQFLKDLLHQPQCESYIRWLDRGKGIFKIEDSTTVAKLWGKRKNRPAMNYDKLSRSIRQYYKKGIIKKTSQSKRLVYQFCPQYNG